MTDPLDRPGAEHHPGGMDAPGPPESTTGVPRWVKVLLVVAVVLAVLVAVMLLTGIGGEHGPSRHALPAGPLG